jgi:hypothetical protein
MSLYELEISWAATANERRYVQWELLACDRVRGVFQTACDDTLAVLFDGGPAQFHDWASRIGPQVAA